MPTTCRHCINSVSLYDAVYGLMSKGLFGACVTYISTCGSYLFQSLTQMRRMHKATIARGRGGGGGMAAQERLELIRTLEGDKFTVAKARSGLRAWLRWSDEGRAVERAVGKLLAGG